MGRYKILDPFKVIPELNHISTGSCQANPTRGLWQRQTYYYFYINQAQNENSYVILEWNLHTSTYGELSEY